MSTNEREASVAKMRNLGPASALMLARAGIDSPAQLRELGAAEAFIRVKLSGQSPSLNLLWSMWGALNNASWNAVPEDVKTQLLREIDVQIG
jgi:DNA transformation protein and related proteins